jgi:hypothetical protein
VASRFHDGILEHSLAAGRPGAPCGCSERQFRRAIGSVRVRRRIEQRQLGSIGSLEDA